MDNFATQRLQEFRRLLKIAADIYKKGKYEKYGFLKEQNYIGITHTKQSNEAYRKLKKKALSGIRLIADMEEGKVGLNGPDEKHGLAMPLCCGFSYKPGTSYVFALNHPGTGISAKAYKTNIRNVQSLFNDPRISIGFHYGIYDTRAVRELLGTNVEKYNYDTLLAEYFRDPNAKKYGLAAIAERRYPDFLDYKAIEGPDAFTPEFKKLLEGKKYAKMTLAQQVMLARNRSGAMNLARMPWKNMVLYNGADVHLTKLVEQDTKKYVNQALMRVYIDASYVLHKMETEKRCLPVFDYSWHRKVSKLFTLREKYLEKQIRRMAGKYAWIPKKKAGVTSIVKEKFKPGSNAHILWLLFDKLGYKFKAEDDRDKPNTRARTLLTLGLKHKKANLIVEYRQCMKAKGTYVEGYKACADLNKGHLRTNWKLTGTSTGRLSSGKTRDKKNDAVINFQNIHGDELIKCLLISDRRYRRMYKYWLKHGDFDKYTWKKFRNLRIDLGFDFSQNELRQLAEESGDKNLIKAFTTTKKWYCKKCKKEHPSDPHVEVGHALTGWSREAIAHNERVRKLVKNMQFGLVYGLQGEGLYSFITMLGVQTTRKEVNKYHRKYFRKYPGVRRLQERYRAFVRKHGYVKNQFGFRRKLDVAEAELVVGEYSDEKRHGAYWGNQAINTPIQGAAHQLLMMAIAAIHRYPRKYKLLKYPNKEIHDALYFSTVLKYLFKAAQLGLKLMLDEPVKIVERDFKLKKRVKLSAKPKAGFRFGVQIEGIGDDVKTPWEFLNKWCSANKKLEKSYHEQMKKLQT